MAPDLESAKVTARSLFDTLNMPQNPDGLRILNQDGHEVFIWAPGTNDSQVWLFPSRFVRIYVLGSAPVTASINAEMKGLCRNRRAEKEMMVKNNSEEAQKKWAEKRFKKEERDREGVKAMLEYQVEGHAVRDKTARLRALRLAKGAAEETG
jgi:hypothetical protein